MLTEETELPNATNLMAIPQTKRDRSQNERSRFNRCNLALLVLSFAALDRAACCLESCPRTFKGLCRLNPR